MATGATYLITGGTGSLGTELCRQLQKQGPPARLAVLSRDWQKQQTLRTALGNPGWGRWFIGDIRDKARVVRAMQGVDYVIHAAAIKDVVSCEYNVGEALATNVLGTQNVVDAAIEASVQKVLVVSTDKACAAANTYGVSKAMAERIAVASNAYAGAGPTRIAVVRYGNVMGSNGSVIPLWKRQAQEQGYITVTDHRMTRFWVPLEQAAQFVLTSLYRLTGGEIFVPKLPSMSVTDLAEAIAPKVDRKETGIRPGEKLHEVLITEDEARHTFDLGDSYLIEPEHPFWTGVRGQAPTEFSDGWSYRSDTNDRWLNTERLRELVGA